ncbi:MAG: cell division protein FtsL [Pseudomonadota bacterium]
MMRSMLYVAALGMVCLVAVWAYQVIERTRDLRAEVAELHGRIAEEREAISVLRAEWAWLNRPERLARLADMHRETLGLGPMAPAHFAEVAAVVYQPPPPRASRRAPGRAAPPREDAAPPLRLMGRSAPATPRGVEETAEAAAPARAVAGPRRGPLPAGLRTPPLPPELAPAETPVTILALAGRDWLALGLTLPPPRPERP